MNCKNFIRSLYAIYEIWESSLESIRNVRDIEEFENTLSGHENYFDSEYKVKEKFLSKMLSEVSEKLSFNKESLETLQQVQFETKTERNKTIDKQVRKLQLIRERHTNIMLAQYKLKKTSEKFREKLNDIVYRLGNLNQFLAQQQNVTEIRGLNPETIASFVTFNADNSLIGSQCTICLEYINVGRIVKRLTCNHHFCVGCIDHWFVEKNSCPNCRFVFN